MRIDRFGEIKLLLLLLMATNRLVPTNVILPFNLVLLNVNLFVPTTQYTTSPHQFVRQEEEEEEAVWLVRSVSLTLYFATN